MKLQVVEYCVLGIMLTLGVAACSANDADSEGKFELGLTISDDAHPADVGLPKYPGSKPYKENDESGSGANIGFSSPLFGLKVAAMKMETPDSPEKVAHFYRQALTRYGTVLECSGHAKQHASARESNSKDDALECDSEDQDAHELVYKVGSLGDQRIVAI
ncbi:MAG: hypothetical protein ACJ8MH_17650 [Povalibacter sp.]